MGLLNPLTEDMVEEFNNKYFLCNFISRQYKLKDFISKSDSKKFKVVTGVKPSKKIGISAKKTMDLAVYFQNTGGVVNYVLADMEAYLVNQIQFNKISEFAYDHILNLLALGFDLNKNNLYLQSKSNEIKELTFKLCRITKSKWIENLYGRSDIQFQLSAVMQCADFLNPQIKNPEKPVLLCLGEDQIPHFYLARKIAKRAGFNTPSAIFFKSKQMEFYDSKIPSIMFDEKIEEVTEKVNKFITGGKKNIKKHKRYGGESSNCYLHEFMLYLYSDYRSILTTKRMCKNGEKLCVDCKEEVTTELIRFLKSHIKERKKIEKRLNLTI